MTSAPEEPNKHQENKQAGVAGHIASVREEISRLELEHGRDPGGVQLLAVSKTKPSEMIREAAAANQVDFGENYADEGAEKSLELRELDLTWHYIGHIQSNKTKLIAGHYDWVQGVDRLKIAKRLSEHRPTELPPLNICIQLKIDAEESKSGCTTEELAELAACIADAPQLILRGLMAIPAPRADTASQREVFRELHSWYQKLQADHATVDTLSMGMSGDMASAIAEGATMVRIGTAVFGARDKR